MKRPKPWFRTSKNAWFVEIDGRQKRIGEHPPGAPAPKKGKTGWNAPPAILEAFYALMAEDEPVSPPTAITVAQVCDHCLEHVQKHTPNDYKWYRGYLEGLCNHRGLGKLPATELLPRHVIDWL